MANGRKPGFFARNRWPVWAVAIASAVVLFAAFVSLRDDSVPIRAAAVERGAIRSVISTNGKVEPLQNFEAHAPIGALVQQVLVKESEHVKKGQLLVQLDDAQAREQAARALAQVRSAQADVSAIERGGTREEVLTTEADLLKAQATRDTAQRNLEALQRLQQQGAASPGEVKAAQDETARANADVALLQQKQKDRYSRPEVAKIDAQQQQAQAAYSAAEDVLSQLNVRAPFDGVVYALPVRQGSYANPGDLVLQMADLSRVRVRAFVDEPDVGRLAQGEKIEVTWDAVPGRNWDGRVETIPAQVKLRGSRNVGETTCVVDNHDYKLLPNINVNITIITAEHSGVLTVPREAVRLDGNKTYVLQVVDDQLKRREVQTAISNLTDVEVSSGLSPDAIVALSSTNSKPLHGGLTVKVVR